MTDSRSNRNRNCIFLLGSGPAGAAGVDINQVKSTRCLVQVGNGIELEAVGLQFEPYWWRPCGVTWDSSRTVVVIKLRRTLHQRMPPPCKRSRQLDHWRATRHTLSRTVTAAVYLQFVARVLRLSHIYRIVTRTRIPGF